MGNPHGSEALYDTSGRSLNPLLGSFAARRGPTRDTSIVVGAPATMRAMEAAPPQRRVSAALAYLSILLPVAAVSVVPDLDLRAAAVLLASAGAGWAAAIALGRRGALPIGPLLAGAVLLRLVALAGEPRLSDDVFRYVWEGDLVLRARSPYAYAPDDPALADLRAQHPGLHARVNHRDVSAAYPPLAHLAGAAAAGFARATGAPPERAGVLFLRTAFALADLLVLVPLAVLLRRRGLGSGSLAAWAWSPLCAVEFAGSGHLDALAIAPWIAALALATGPRPRTAAFAALAVAGLVKLLPFVSLPTLSRDRARRATGLALALAVAVLACAPWLAFDGGGRGWLVGLRNYAERWEGSSLVYRWIEAAYALWFEPAPGWTDPSRLARATVAATWLAYAARTWARVVDPATAARRLIAAWLLLTPTLHPWYATWLLPLLALEVRAAWVFLVAALPLAYWPLEGWQRAGAWVEPAWLWPALALPFAALAARERFAPRARAGDPLPPRIRGSTP